MLQLTITRIPIPSTLRRVRSILIDLQLLTSPVVGVRERFAAPHPHHWLTKVGVASQLGVWGRLCRPQKAYFLCVY